MRVLGMLSAAAVIWLAFSNPALSGATDAESFGARSWPSAPRLDINEEPKLCSESLASATAAFLSDSSDLDIGAAISAAYPPVAMKPVIVEGNPGSTSQLSRADLDLDGDGRRQVVIYRDNPFNWKGNWHYSYVFPSPEEFEAMKANALTNWSQPDKSQYPLPSELDLGAQQYFPSALTSEGKSISTGNVWAPHSLFSFEGRYYFVFALNDFDRLAPHSITIYRLRASGRADPRCRIATATADRAAGAFASLPGMASFLSVIRTIGEPGPDSGTLHAETMHNAQAEWAVTRAASRPWTVAANVTVGYTQGEYFVFGPRMKLFLEDWSLLELWNRREYQTLLASMSPAIESYVTFLRTEFGMQEPAATHGAKRVIENLLARRILIPSQYEEGPGQLLYFPQSTLHRAVMLRDRDAFEAEVSILKARAAAKDIDPPFDEKAEYSSALLDAVEWTYGLDRLLELGADPDTVNGFGKSPLMVAAHFDRIDSVRKLLRAGATVSLLTTEAGRFSFPLTRTNRTALMYAAENASPPVIKALLDAGADKSSVDSQGNGMSFYLASNPRFTIEQRERGIEAISAGGDAFSRASFDCGRARTNTELTICTSAALRVFDTEVDIAFARLKHKGGRRVVNEQRTWLEYRDGACNANSDADCLAEVMRTRLRYLHMRLRE